MAILSGIPVLNCQSIEETLAFYQQILQFVVVNKREFNGELRWVHIMHGETTLMLQAVGQHQSGLPPTENTKISLYFFVNKINELHHFIKAKNNLLSEIESTDYHMQEFTVLDPEGNTITIGMVADGLS
jgi:catechol 2,3-dioxygenase-like lactoylglutathione lyase family enzyme